LFCFSPLGEPEIVNERDRMEASRMMNRLAAGAVAGLQISVNRLRARLAEEDGQGTVEYAGLAMAIGVLLIAVGSYLGGKDHGIGSVVTGAIKSAVERAAGGK
jgi:Flp pilus assembly pilin Flp